MITNSTTIRNALAMAQQICHERFCDPHPMGQSEVCKTLLEAMALLDRSAAGDVDQKDQVDAAAIASYYPNVRGTEKIELEKDIAEALRSARQVAATRMRDKCMGETDAAISGLSRTSIAAEQNAREIGVLATLREDLSSLTLDSVEQEKTK